jgi:hypothetical protein
VTETAWITVWDFRSSISSPTLFGALSIIVAGLIIWLVVTGREGVFRNWLLEPAGLPSQARRSMLWIIAIGQIVFGFVLLGGSLTSTLSLRSSFAEGHFEVVEGVYQSVDSVSGAFYVGTVEFNNRVARNWSAYRGRFPPGRTPNPQTVFRISHIDGEILRVERREQPPTDTPH